MDFRDIQQLLDAGLVSSEVKDGDIFLLARPNPQRGDKYAILAIDKKDLFSTTVLGYKSYVALLTQSGTSAPTAIVLENTLGEDVVWSYSGPGQYILNSVNGVFTENKTYIMASHTTVSGLIIVERFNTMEAFVGTINSSTLTYQNNLLDKSSIEIRVYN